MATPTILDVQDLCIRFGGIQAISNLTFSVHEGELVSLIGPNGAGKTTAFNAISGFLRLTSGQILYRGQAINGMKPHQIAGLGLVRTFQKTSLFENSTVFENILTGLHHRGQRRTWEVVLALPRVADEERRLREEAKEIIDFVGLASRSMDLAGALPYGEQRLLGVGIALAARPQLMMLDEPVSGMNPTETLRFMQMLKRIRQRGMSILLVEHDMRMVMSVSDRVIALNYGSVIADGTPTEIQHNPEVIRIYLGQGAKVA